jgi:FAD/FMN-containing dehydrogenase
MVKIQSWGRINAPKHHLHSLNRDVLDLGMARPLLPFGNGRSYGDVCLNPDGHLIQMQQLDRFINFNPDVGTLTCEAGILLQTIHRHLMPQGWMLPVTPGTQLITVGGAIANDVHGKNHHQWGTFGNHVQSFKLLRTDNQILTCSPTENTALFHATIGGLGLTGIILEATLQLRSTASPWYFTESLPYYSLDAFFNLADTSIAHWEHTVSWLDCCSGEQVKGIFMRANAIPCEQKPPKPKIRAISFTPPISLINSYSLKAFNQLYFYLHKNKKNPQIQHYEPFFYPLDSIHEWNRIYGPKGFYQYQVVIPKNESYAAISELLKVISKHQQGSFLAVLKTFGDKKSPGMLSFPMEGATLALDFPNLGDKTLKLFNLLDTIVKEARGRIYPAKDARMSQALFEAGYPNYLEFLKYRDRGIRSSLSQRLLGY